MSSNAFQNKSIALPVAHALKVAGVCKNPFTFVPKGIKGGVGEGHIFGLQYSLRKRSSSGDQLNG